MQILRILLHSHALHYTKHWHCDGSLCVPFSIGGAVVSSYDACWIIRSLLLHAHTSFNFDARCSHNVMLYFFFIFARLRLPAARSHSSLTMSSIFLCLSHHFIIILLLVLFLLLVLLLRCTTYAACTDPSERCQRCVHYSASQQRNHNTIFFAGLRDKLRAWRNSQSHSHTEDKSNRGFFLHIRRIICPEMRYRLHVCTSSQPQILTNVSLRVDYEHRRIAHTRPAARPLALSFARYELWNITHSTVIVDHWEIP